MSKDPIDVVVVGAGNLGMFVYDCLIDDPRWRCKAFIDDGKAGQTHFGIPIFGTDDYDPGGCRKAFLAVGYPDIRRQMVRHLSKLDFDWQCFIDRRSLVGPGAVLGKGVLVLSFAMIASGVQIGDFSYISSYAHAGAGAKVGCYTSVMTGAVVGDSAVGNDCVIGLKSACIDGAVIGDGATIAPYTCVRHHVPSGALVVSAASTARVVDRASLTARDSAQTSVP